MCSLPREVLSHSDDISSRAFHRIVIPEDFQAWKSVLIPKTFLCRGEDVRSVFLLRILLSCLSYIGSLAIPCSHGWSRVRGICPHEEQSECEGLPKKLSPQQGCPSQAGALPFLPSAPIPTGCCCRPGLRLQPMGDASHSCIFCGVSTHFPPSFSSDCQENLGLAQTSCLPLAATTPPWISPCLSQPSQLPSLLLTHTQQLTQMNFPEQTFLFGGAQLGLRWVALGHMGGHRDACPASRSGSDP